MEKFFKIFLLLVEVASDVLQKLLENRYQADNIPDFTIFLPQKQHELFHLCFTRSGPCCSCQMQNNAPNQQQSITRTVFDKMFSENSSALCAKHVRTHSCKYDVKRNFKLTDIDVTLGTSLILNFYQATLDRTEADCITDIRQVRNEIAHHSDNSDIPDKKFQESWGKIVNATVRLASCVSQNYRSEIEDKIKVLRNRTICDKDRLFQRFQLWQEDFQLWQEENEEKMNAIVQDMQLMHEGMQMMHGKFDQFTRDMETRYKDETDCRRKKQDTSSGRRDANGREPLQDIEGFTEVKQVVDDEDQKYYQTYNEIEQLRRNGKDDPRDAWKYLILCYIVLQGSSDEDMDKDVLENMGMSIFGSPVTFPVDNKICLLELTPKFVVNIDSTYTAANVSISKAVVYSYGYISPSQLSELCSSDILYEFVLPSCIETDDILIKVNTETLVKNIIEKIQDNPTRIGEYLRKLRKMKGNKTCISMFANRIIESDAQLSADHMIGLLDGLRKEGKDFRIFQNEKKMMNAIFCPVDKFDNTIFHYLVVRFPESDRFSTYIKYFSEENIITALPNTDDLTPLYLAAYLGRYGVVSYIISSLDKSDLKRQREDILSNVNDGIELLLDMNSKKEVSSKVNIEIPNVHMGDIKDYMDILDILGVGHNDTKTDESEDSPNKGATKSGKDDESKVVGDAIISLVTDIKKGVDAITKIPDLVKTINQATT